MTLTSSNSRMLPARRRALQAGAFLVVRLEEFLAGWLLLLLLISISEISTNGLIRSIEDGFKMGMVAAFLYEIMSLYILVAAAVWIMLVTIKKDHWIPLSVPIVFLLHCIYITSTMLHDLTNIKLIGERTSEQNFEILLAIGIMTFVDFFLGRLARPERLYRSKASQN